MKAAGEGNPTASLPNYEVVDQICTYNETGSIKTICKSIYLCVFVFGMYLYLSVHESKIGDGVKFHGYY